MWGVEIGGILDIEEVPESPWRNRSVEENLREFERMKNGEYAEGEVPAGERGHM